MSSSTSLNASSDGNSQKLLIQSFRDLFSKIDNLESTLDESVLSSSTQKQPKIEKKESEAWGEFVPLKKEDILEILDGGKKRTQVLQKQQYQTLNFEDVQRETKKRLNMLIKCVKAMENASDKNYASIEDCLTLIFEILHNGLLRNGLKVITTQKGGPFDDLKSISSYLCKEITKEKSINELENTVAGTSYLESLSGLISTLKGKREQTNNIVFLKAMVASVLCYFETNQQEAHKSFIELTCHVLQFLINECYKLIYPDPRDLLYGGRKDDIADAHLEHIQKIFNLNPSNKDSEEPAPLEDTILSPLEFCQLFKVYSTMLQRALTTAYPFTLNINTQLLINRVLQEAFLLQAISTQVLQKPNKEIRSILYTTTTDGTKLQSSFYAVILPTIHSECLKSLSALINLGGEQLLPYMNSICQILVTETRNWKSSMLIALCDYCNSEPYFEVYKELMRCLSIMTAKHGAKVSEKCTQVVLPHLVDIISQFTHFVDHQVFSLPLTQLQQQNHVENYELSLKKKKKKKVMKVEDDLILNPEIFSQYSRVVFVTLKCIQHMMNNTSVLVSTTRQVDSSRYRSASEAENSVVDVLSTLVDFITNSLGFINKWHELDEFFSTSNISIYSASQVKSYHEDLIPIITAMYDALVPSLLSTSSVHTQSPFTTIALNALQRGKSSAIPEIVSSSMMGLNIFESFLHPKSAPLYVPSAESVNESSVNSRKSQIHENDSQSRFANRLMSLSENQESEDEEEEQAEEESSQEEQMQDDEEEQEKPVKEVLKAASKAVEGRLNKLKHVLKNTKEDDEEEQEEPVKEVLKAASTAVEGRLNKLKDVLKKTKEVEKEPESSKKRTVSEVTEKPEQKTKQRMVETPKKSTLKLPETKYNNTDKEDFEDAAHFSSDDEVDTENINLVDDSEIGDVSGLDLHF
ncbi:predicted protein [Naegleria gruberi]|uniref:Predicted protein n=1 Tax=Naegleria gruberi TaxID=5762 RepID=D2VRR9_NAEGR|nr:uncharacterized protein NAEGRDRAFT_71682 [Naegleria gruberi]EFC40511.1 predicted protein [Naegleria gruberi]|eukprot:XP_002673255.1 predicted protein [Naegleria gruberi strain NEG-M]